MDGLNKDLGCEGLIPEFLRGQSRQFNLSPPGVPMDDVAVQRAFELLEGAPCPAPEELVLDMAEDLLRRAVVDAVALPRHALRDPVLLQAPRPAALLVLPSHVAVQDGRGALRHLGEQLVEDVVLLRHARAARHRPGDDLLAAEVVYGGEVGLAPGLLELRDVGAHLLPRGVGPEVAADDVLEGLADLALVRVVAVVVGLAPDPAAQAHLAHDLQHGLVGDAHAQLGPQAHRYLPVPAAVGGAREHLPDELPQLGPRRLLGMRDRVIIARSREPCAFQQVGEPVSP